MDRARDRGGRWAIWLLLSVACAAPSSPPERCTARDGPEPGTTTFTCLDAVEVTVLAPGASPPDVTWVPATAILRFPALRSAVAIKVPRPGVEMLSFPALTSAGRLEVAPGANLAALELPALESVEGDLALGGTSLAEVSLPELAVVSGSLAIAENRELRRLDLPRLTAVGSGLTISGNTSLEALHLPALVAGELSVRSSPALAALLLPALEVAGRVDAVDLLGLERLQAPALTAVSGDLRVINAPRLVALELPGLRAVGGFLDVSYTGVLQPAIDAVLAQLTSGPAGYASVRNAALPAPDIRVTRHNLSASSSFGTVHAATLDEVCVFCHNPHGGISSRPTWNRDFSYQSDPAFYTVYSSTTLDSVLTRPTGTARLCLSCHDGALHIGALMNLDADRPGTVLMEGGITTMPPGGRLLGADLRNDHPVSVVPALALDPDLAPPPPGDDVRLREGSTPDVADTVQCPSCHDPHLPTRKFLVKEVARGALCLTCHPKAGWAGSRHEASLATYPAGGTTTVGERACLNCHTPHNAQSPSRLLHAPNLSGTGGPLPWAEENVCFQCHRAGGTGVDPVRGLAAPDLRTQFSKATAHPVSLKLDEHQPVFTRTSPDPEAPVNTSKHVECVDCHNPHQVQALPGNVHEGMKGVSVAGATVIDDAAVDLRQYEVCFRCHGDSFATMIPPAPVRPPSGSNKRLEFNPANAAYHPVAAPGKNTSPFLNNVLDAPSGQLQGNDWQGNQLSRLSTVLCTDCHNNEATADVLGSARNSPSGPKGPHGSANVRLLRAPYSTLTGGNSPPFSAYNPANFALCFRCHQPDRLQGLDGNYSNFFQAGSVGAGRGNLHYLHLQDRTQASCHECHNNVHSNVQAANTDYRNIPAGTPTHLVNFAPSVRPYSGSDPHYGDIPTVPRWGRTPGGDYYCLARCHGRNAMDGNVSVYRPPNP